MKLASDVRKTKDALFEEFEAWFSTYPLDAGPLQAELDAQLAALDTPYPYGKKALAYAGAAECGVKVLRHSPFYFELCSGRIRNSSQNGYPPGPGLEGWYMRKNQPMADGFAGWMQPLQSADLIWGEMFVDCAHHTVGYDRLLKLGFSGIARQAEQQLAACGEPRKRAFYEAVLAACTAMRRVGEHFAAEAERLLGEEHNPELQKNLHAIAGTAGRVPWQPVGSFYEALCTIAFAREVFMAVEGLAVAVWGHLDRLLVPYYQADLDSGVLTRQEAKNLLAHFLVLTDARWDLTDGFASTNSSVTIGGCDRSGAPVWNEVSRMAVEIYAELELVNPKLQVRIGAGHPRQEIEACCALIAGGRNVFSFINDEVIIESNVRMGKKLEDARLYSAGGCQEPVLDNCEFNSRAFLYVNMPQLVNSFFDADLARLCGEELCAYDSFEALYTAYVQRLHNLFLQVTAELNRYEARAVEYNPCPMLSATMEDCLEAGLDMMEGGARYNATSIPLVGIGTAINALLAIKEVVFDRQMVRLEELGRVLAADFAGHERLHSYLMNRCPKYGADSPEVNAFATRLFRDVARATSGVQNARGGLYEASLFVFYLFDWMKKHTGATADGRRAGTPVSRGMGPSDISGVSNIATILKTVGEIDLADYPGCGVVYLEMPLTQDGATAEQLAAVVEVFRDSGGSALDLSMLDPALLQRARHDPDTYRGIVVRVCGFSAYFTALEPAIQDEIIARTMVH
ncbi:hypothetical protein LJC64_00915 [Ruminococcaceae bacterium OttesenSCG-928-A11]|nr:hypothetical protein [Ruminococcaceae bacterium OttesenSCG-928-A11]